MKCPKCKAVSGDDWTQCEKSCPMPGSPHFRSLRSDQMNCPACGGIAECESVDVGVGLVLRGDFACECGWEIDGPEDFGFIEGPDDGPQPGEGLS